MHTILIVAVVVVLVLVLIGAYLFHTRVDRKFAIGTPYDCSGRDIGDSGVSKDVSLRQCQQACLDNSPACVGVSYNPKTRDCTQKNVKAADLQKCADNNGFQYYELKQLPK